VSRVQELSQLCALREGRQVLRRLQTEEVTYLRPLPLMRPIRVTVTDDKPGQLMLALQVKRFTGDREH
jgi:hypothetical protein